MSRPHEFDVPQLGPAQRGDTGAARTLPPAGGRGPAAPESRGGNLLHSLVLVLLTGATSGLGYWGYGLQQELDRSREQLARAGARLGELEQLLEVTSDSAAQSGQTLSGRLEQFGRTAEAKYGHFDSEIAKLWTIAYQRNKPKLETLEAQLAEQTGRLDAQEKALDAQTKALEDGSQALKAQDERLQREAARVESLSGQLDGLGAQLAKTDDRLASLAGLEAGQAAIRGELEQTLDELRRSLAALDTQVRIAEEVQAEKSSTQQAALKKLGERISGLEGRSDNGDLGRRVRVNEQAIQAIDGSRRQFNQELLQLRAQLNNLQRRLQ